MEVCRYSSGSYNVTVFNLWTCALCYKYLFQQRDSKHSLIPNWNSAFPILTTQNASFSAVPNIDSPVNTKLICGTLGDQECDRWTSCCQAAKSCCHRQTRARPATDNTCPRTWDGFGCFEDTDAGQTAVIACPEFIEYGFVSDYAKKVCTPNATWWREPVNNREWTDYTPCLNIKVYKMVVYVGLASCSLSIVLLTPAIIIFLYVRQLRCQQRIRIHICLFMSFILTSLFTLLWDILVYKDLLDNPRHLTLMHQNSWGCRLLYFLKRYSISANYFWMFCEGLYLHRLIVHAFRVPRYLLWYYFFGWALPFIPVSIYAVIKAGISNHGCWVKNIGAYEWIIYTPNLACVLANCVFLFSILRIIISQLQSHPNEPSGYRRAIKATLVLVPLFGLHIFFIIYRPHSPSTHRLLYEIISTIITDSQGTMVSMIYCFGNGEVHAYLRARMRNCTEMQQRIRTGSNTLTRTPVVSMSHYTAISTNQSRHSTDSTILCSVKGNHLESQKRVNINGNVQTH